jgi:hypothetical protein
MNERLTSPWAGRPDVCAGAVVAVAVELAKKPGERSLSAPVGGFAVYSKARPSNVYPAYPGSNLQFEVYNPAPKRARGRIASGQVAAVR